MKTCIMNTLIVIESLTIVNLLNKVQFPFVKVFPPQMLSSSSEGAIVQAVPIAFAPVILRGWPEKNHPPTPTKSSSSIFQCNFLGWLRKNFTAGSQKSRSVIIWASKRYIPIIYWFRNGHLTVILTFFFTSTIPWFKGMIPWFQVMVPWNQVPYPEIRVW